MIMSVIVSLYCVSSFHCSVNYNIYIMALHKFSSFSIFLPRLIHIKFDFFLCNDDGEQDFEKKIT